MGKNRDLMDGKFAYLTKHPSQTGLEVGCAGFVLCQWNNVENKLGLSCGKLRAQLSSLLATLISRCPLSTS